MVDNKMIEEIKSRLIKVYNPLEIYIFGSYAWGSPTKESDLDLLIVVDKSEERSYKRPIAGGHALADIMVSKDIVVYTKEEFERRANDVTTLCHKIKEEGTRIYAVA